MDELVARISGRLGIDPLIARSAVIVILKFLLKEGPSQQVNALVDSLPGARAAVDSSPQTAAADMMGVFSGLAALGLGVGAIQTVAHNLVDFARDKAGPEIVDEIVGSIPGLGQLV